MIRKIQTLLYVSIFLSPMGISPLMADQSNEILGLEEALSLAYQQNPRIVQARKAIEGSQGDLITARTWANPEVEAEIGGLRKDDEGRRKGHLDSITFKQNFDPPGVRFLESKIAQNDVTIQQEALKSVWSEVYLEVREICARVVLDKKELELKQSNLKSMRQFFSNVQLRYESGQTMRNHLQRAKIELLKSESDYLKAENDLNVDKARMNLVLGRPREIVFDIKDELKEETLESNLDELIEIALTKRPDVKMEEAELDSKIKNARKEQLNRLPSYSLGFQRINEDYEKDYAAVVEVSIPLWNLNQGEVKKARSEREAQKVKLEAMKNEVAFEVYVIYQEAQLALKQLDLFRKSLEEANEMFRLAGLRYKEGEIDFINYLDQVKASMDSRMQYYQGLYQLNQSISALEKSIYSSLRGEEFLK
jgi:outer membrane protein TolC